MAKKTYTLQDLRREGLVKSRHTGRPLISIVQLRTKLKLLGYRPQLNEDGSNSYALTKEDIKKLNK